MRPSWMRQAAAGAGVALALIYGGAPVLAQDYRAGTITIGHPWAPPTLGKLRIGAVYFTLHNHGPRADRLLGVDLPEGGTAQLHNSEIKDGVMRMRPIDAPTLPPGGEMILRPGGMHVMLSGLPGALISGRKLPLTLRFEQAGAIEVQALIELPTKRAAPESHQGH